jgi:hypothetical protein
MLRKSQRKNGIKSQWLDNKNFHSNIKAAFKNAAFIIFIIVFHFLSQNVIINHTSSEAGSNFCNFKFTRRV